MEKRTCLVTGGTSGVGLAIANSLAGRGDHVIITSRTAESGERAALAISRKSGSNQVDSMVLDLADLSSIDRFASAFKGKYLRLNLLSLNAGVISLKRASTPTGCSLVCAVNYLGHFYLTRLLTDLLRESAPSRIIAVTGNAGVIKNLRVDIDRIWEEIPYHPIKDALQAALLKTMFVFELARRLQGSGVTANAFHPGLVKSRLTKTLPFPLNLAAGAAGLLMSKRCPTGEYLASDAGVEGQTGGFYERSRKVDLELKHHGPADWSELWEHTERVIGGDL